MRPYIAGEDVTGISISDADRNNGSPKEGDMICRNPDDPKDMWLIAENWFKEHFDPIN